MSEFPGQIWIGGQLSRTAMMPNPRLASSIETTVLQNLIAALSADGASHEFGDKVIDANCTEHGLGDYLTDDGRLLTLKCAEAVNGEFPKTEQFCMNHGIPFDRWGDAYGDCDAENVYFRPGMDTPIVRYSDSSGNEVVDGDTVRQAMQKLTDSIAPGSADAHVDYLADALRLLHDACPELPPALELFNIVA